MLSAREAGDLSHIERRLVAKFVPPLRPEVVRSCIEASAARHDSGWQSGSLSAERQS